VKLLRWLMNGRLCPRCHEYTGYRFYSDCEICEIVDVIRRHRQTSQS
jgi:hypothetical protein